MAVTSVLDDYLFAVMLHAQGTKAENGTFVLTVPEFRGIIACGGDARQVFDELFRQLEIWIRLSDEKGYLLPVIESENGDIDLNTGPNRNLIKYHQSTSIPRNKSPGTYIGGPDEFDRFLQEEVARAE